nr:flagellar biosynthesis anti-sigma factor FlgM [Cupriavidus pauculus]
MSREAAGNRGKAPKVSGRRSDKSEEPSKDFTVKINNSTPSRPADSAATEGNARAAASGTAATDPSSLTGVRVSPLAAQVREIGARLLQDSDSDIDAAKVEEVRQAIAEGRIKIDPSKIADGLLASLHELSQAPSQS